MVNEDINVVIPERVQLKLFQYSCSNDLRIRVLVGSFYEALAQAYFGGKRKIREILLRESYGGGLDFEVSCEPDIEDSEKERYIEVKASKSNNYFRLRDLQFTKYKMLMEKESHWKEPKLDFAFFTYNIKNINRECPTEDNLIESLAKKTSSCIIMPFDAVKNIWEKSRKHYSSVQPAYAYFDRRDANMFLNGYEKAFDKFGIEAKHHEVRKETFPENYVVEGSRVSPFPIVEIKEKNV